MMMPPPCAERAGIGEHAGERRSRRRLRADEVDLSVRRAAAALKVAVEGAQGNAAGVRCLDTAAAEVYAPSVVGSVACV